MFAREQLIATARALLSLRPGRRASGRPTAPSRRCLATPTCRRHRSSRRVSISPPSAPRRCDRVRRLGHTYGEVDQSPLGAGAMAGQELAWDRDRMARLLGFAGPVPMPWWPSPRVAGHCRSPSDLSGYGVALSRFATDLMMWGSAGFGYIDLPDDLSGISSAMPQKKNFPILERIRGRSAHVAAFAVDLAMGQRSTPYSNMVEVSKEAGAHLWDLFRRARLDAAAVHHTRRTPALPARADAGRVRARTISAASPWRTCSRCAPACPGARPRCWRASISSARTERGLTAGPARRRPVGRRSPPEHGVNIDGPGDAREAFSVDGALRAKTSSGSTNPDSVREMLTAQEREYDTIASAWQERAERISGALAETDATLGVGALGGEERGGDAL